jgi:hypothetical protein
LVLLLTGCATAPPPQPPPPKPEPQPIAVAVIELGGSTEAEDGCARAILEANHRAIEKQRVDQALPTDDDIDYQKLGRLLGADLIIDGGIARGVKLKKVPPARIVSTQKGDILASSASKIRVNKSYQVAHDVCAELLRQLP